MIGWIEVEEVRNLQAQRIELSPGLTLVAGRNAQGKTSLLEAIYLLATTRSFRTARPEQAIRHGAEALIVRGEARRTPVAAVQALKLGKQGRELRREGREVGLEDYLAGLDVVAMSSRSVRALAGVPEERRRFLDRGAALVRAGHLRDLRDFRRALAQRNRLLKEIGDSRTGERRARELLRPWNDTLSTAAAAVVAARREFALDLDSRARNVPEKLLPERADLRVAYRPSPGYDSGAREGYEAALRSRLAARVADEIRLGYTVAGPQRDELSLTVAGKDLLIYGSSGQQRAALIAQLLAQMELTRERKGAYPVLLLDDVDSDIDEARIATLLDGLGESFQAVVATSKGSLPGADARLRLTMKNGRAERGSPTRGSAEV